MTMPTMPAQLQEYQSHKRVHAGRIDSIEYLDHTTVLHLADSAGSVSVAGSFMNRHEPAAGGYFVQYADGYQSYSPGDAFELGYAPVKEGAFENKGSSDEVNLLNQVVAGGVTIDEYSRAQKRQHLADLISQLTNTLAIYKGASSTELRGVTDRLIAELSSLV